MTDFDVKTREFLTSLHNRCDQDPTDPYFLRTFFRGLVSAHWETASNHGRFSPLLGCHTLKTDVNIKGDLVVKMAYEFDAKNPTPVPSVNINVGDTTLKKHVLANLTDRDAKTGEKTHAWEAACPITFTHTFHDSETALIAAQSTFEFLAGVSHEVMRSLAGSLFEPIHFSAVKKTQPDPNPQFSVDVIFSLNYDMSMSINLESHRIKVIETNLSPE